MGIKVEFNPDLCLRNFPEYQNGNKKIEECLPEKLEADKIYPFLKKDQRLYWLDGEIPLRETKGGGNLSRALASINITEATHFRKDGETWTKGYYKITEIFTDDKIHFDGLEKLKI